MPLMDWTAEMWRESVGMTCSKGPHAGVKTTATAEDSKSQYRRCNWATCPPMKWFQYPFFIFPSVSTLLYQMHLLAVSSLGQRADTWLQCHIVPPPLAYPQCCLLLVTCLICYICFYVIASLYLSFNKNSKFFFLPQNSVSIFPGGIKK